MYVDFSASATIYVNVYEFLKHTIVVERAIWLIITQTLASVQSVEL